MHQTPMDAVSKTLNKAFEEWKGNAEQTDDIVKAFGLSVKAKLPGHGINNPDFVKPVRPMSAIGG